MRQALLVKFLQLHQKYNATDIGYWFFSVACNNRLLHFFVGEFCFV